MKVLTGKSSCLIKVQDMVAQRIQAGLGGTLHPIAIVVEV